MSNEFIGSGRDLFEVLFLHLPGGTEENTKHSTKTVGVPPSGILTEQLPITSPERYFKICLLGQEVEDV
jgi:hypothetical protein